MKRKTKKLYKRIVKNFSRIKWTKLKPAQKHLRNLSLKVLSMMRTGKSLRKSSKEIGINFETVKMNIKSAIRKKYGRWIPRKTDRIQRKLVINEKGKSKSIIVTNSKDASLIGVYHNVVKKFLETGDTSILRSFKRKTIIDAKGKKHKLETNPEKLYEIAEAREDEEFYDIYSD